MYLDCSTTSKLEDDRISYGGNLCVKISFEQLKNLANLSFRDDLRRLLIVH